MPFTIKILFFPSYNKKQQHHQRALEKIKKKLEMMSKRKWNENTCGKNYITINIFAHLSIISRQNVVNTQKNALQNFSQWWCHERMIIYTGYRFSLRFPYFLCFSDSQAVWCRALCVVLVWSVDVLLVRYGWEARAKWSKRRTYKSPKNNFIRWGVVEQPLNFLKLFFCNSHNANLKEGRL